MDLTEENTCNVGSVLNFASADMMRKIRDEHLANDRNKIPIPLYYNRLNTGRPKPTEKDDTYIRFCSNYNGCGNLALFPFGYGLSYGNFVYEGLRLNGDSMTADETRIT